MFRRGLGGVHHALQVGGEHGLQVVFAVLGDGFGNEDPGVVHQHVHLAETFDGTLEQAPGGFRHGDVAGHTDEVPRIAQLFGGGSQALFAAGRSHYVEAAFQIGLGQAQADAAGGAGDHHCSIDGLHVDSPRMKRLGRFRRGRLSVGKDYICAGDADKYDIQHFS
ncbi:hypothetical protein D3C72_1787320 [compost metagenome]